MKRVFLYLGIGLGGLVAILVIAAVALFALGQSRVNSAPDVALRPVVAATDATSRARGEHLVTAISDCVGCHGPDLGGTNFVDEPGMATIAAPNLTTGAGGIGNDMNDDAWEAAIRHGIGHDGRALFGMPSNAYAFMSDDDLGALIAYIKTVPPVDSDWPARSISFPGTIVFGILAYNDAFTVSFIDHENVGGSAPSEAVTAEYGEYLSRIGGCRDCHGPDLSGRTPEQAENGPPAGPNLRQSGELNGWSDTDFTTAIRTGVTPSGQELTDEMPWSAYKNMTDTEIMALWAYLTTLD